ncbi:hypothetical protein [Streptomyces sp. NPDC047000]|uniref:hypothetical protein n=1 Tax=Streptomyces sp. NPDC047000 TaxID=3155474 RepID=UPI0033D509B0
MPGDAVDVSGRPDLVSSPAEKRAAARSLERHIEPDTAKAGRWAEEETAAAVKALADGWATASALRKAHDTWSDQVRNLLDRLGSERDALGAGNRVLTSADLAAGSALRETSALDRY